ncbi:MAG: calcium/proton exchanger [Gemmatimonadota bacterium]
MARPRTAQLLLSLLFVFVPISVTLEYALHARPVVVFACAALGIVPLAGLMGMATERLAERLGSVLGGLLNATLGNASELIISVVALRAGLIDLVKASVTGSIIGNILLVFGLSALLGGLRHPKQRFNRTAASLGSTMLLLSAIGLIIPALFHSVVGPGVGGGERGLSLEIAAVLVVSYALTLLFSLKSHGRLLGGEPGGVESTRPGSAADSSRWSVRKALVVLAAAAALVGLLSELLVGAASQAAAALGMSEIFIGVIVVATIGNAAEHSTAIVVARKDRMDLAIQIAIGSSLQIALFVAPALVFLSYAIAPEPMDLRFTTLEVVSVTLAVLTMSQIAHDGETHWMEGVQLLAVYLILALAFFYFPA